MVSVYRAYNADGELLYVGCTLHPIVRLNRHINGARWKDEVVVFEIDRFDTREEARFVEKMAIIEEAPIYNIALNTTREVPVLPGAERDTQPRMCPGCGEKNRDRVIDSRVAQNHLRRRRACEVCGARWTTREVAVIDAGEMDYVEYQ